MSDREFSGFDVETVKDNVSQPPLDDLRAAAHFRRRRRKGGVALAVVAVLAGVAFAPIDRSPDPLEFAGPDPTGSASQRRASELVVLSDKAAVAVEVAEEGCRISFAATIDAGRSWSDWQAARHSGTCTMSTNAESLGATDVRYSVLSEQSYLVRFDDELVLSTDAGRTWHDANSTGTAVTAFPKKARPVPCQQGCGAINQPLAVDPTSGRVFRLTGQPPSPYPPYNIYESPDGALWITYWPGEYGRPSVLARSVDRGATWQTSQAPEGTTSIGVAAVSGQEAYLLTEPLPADPNGPRATAPSRLLRTINGGQSWTDVGTDLPTTDGVRPFTIGADGSLMVLHTDATPAFVMISRDGGRHFTKAREYGDGRADANPGRAWLYGRDDQSVGGADHVQLTTDGSSWTRFPLPH
ncbi:hypothetical protein SAMN05444365_1011183 [Micromonospora pattaloongensis]|uniref:BNR repeat-like domain-containing protein n=1 Tax=Micromonospora pattaloongensis TaxID=405436 RepID=A0A1H3ICC7_9ACTN|nr:hypothetical protein [Micromonospora pattaloongensis]SDY24554.1 hypothetical protein SAMN05444365_1011183 [Micromonospora pattaloongensis]